MASDATFSSLADTQRAQRLSGLEPTHSALSQLDLIVDSVRVEFYTRLGLTRLNAIIAFDETEPPVTDNEYLRLAAKTTEQKMIRKGLLNWLTFAAKEGEGGRINQEWNDVGAFRDMSPRRIKEEANRLDAEVERAMVYLSGVRDAGESPSIRATTIGSELEPQHRKVGASLWAVPAYLFHFALDTDTNNAG